jgi:hypothetical protein
LSGTQPGDLPHLPHAPGSRLQCCSLYWGLISLIIVILSNLYVNVKARRLVNPRVYHNEVVKVRK